MDLERSDLGREHGMSAALGQGRHPHLRIRTATLPATGTGTPEELGIRRGVRNVENRAVHRDQPPPPIPGPLRPRDCHRPAHPREQGPQRLRTRPQTGPADRRRRGHPPGLHPPAFALQPLDQKPSHLFMALPEKQTHRQDEVDHHPCRQQPRPLLDPAALGNHLVDQLRRKRPRQHPQRDPIREPINPRRLHLTRP